MNGQHAATVLSGVRRKLVGDAVGAWKRQLVDLSAHTAALRRRHQPRDVSLFDAQNALIDLHQRYGDAATPGHDRTSQTAARVGAGLLFGTTVMGPRADRCRRDLQAAELASGRRRWGFVSLGGTRTTTQYSPVVDIEVARAG